MRYRSLHFALCLLLCNFGLINAQTASVVDQLREKMVTNGFDSLKIAAKMKIVDKQNDESINMLIEALDNDTDPSRRHTRYHDPDFEKLAQLMISMFKHQLEQAAKDNLPGLSDSDVSAIVKSDYYKPVIELIDMMGIEGFDVSNLKKLDLNPYNNQPISQILVTSTKQTPDMCVNDLAKALSSLYRSYGMKVRSMYNVHNSGERVIASVYGERQNTNQPPAVKLTFDGGELTNVSGIRPNLKLATPESKNDDFIYDYLAFPNSWLKAIPDSVLWLSLFDSPRWKEKVEDDEIIMVSDKGSQVVGYDKQYYASKVVTVNKVNRLFIDWYVPYQGLSLEKNASDKSSLQLITPTSKYPIDANGHIAEADASSQKVLNSIREALAELRAKMAQETEMYGYKSYIDVLDATICNTDEDFNMLNTSTLYADEVRFLAPKLRIQPHTSIPRDIKILHKIYDPKGKLCAMSWSPKGYTSVTALSVNPDEDTIVLTAWGDAEKGVFKPGVYRLEVYSEAGTLLYKTVFDIISK